jgi:hypothetical protein
MDKFQILGMVSEFLASVDRGTIRATCAIFTAKPPQTVEEELLALKAEKVLWMRRAIATQEKLTTSATRCDKIGHCLEMRIRREYENGNEPDSDQDELNCDVCGRAGGSAGFTYNLQGGGVLCEPCYNEEASPAEILSFY